MAAERTAKQHRKTKETDINLTLNLDGSGTAQLNTGIGFFDHMLDGFARHGFFDLRVHVTGDLIVDTHHTIEDTGIVLGNAIRIALRDKKGIKRYGSCILPMDETLVLCAIDLSGRPYFSYCRAGGLYGYGDGERVLLCHFLQCRNEPAYEDFVRAEQSPHGGRTF